MSRSKNNFFPIYLKKKLEYLFERNHFTIKLKLIHHLFTSLDTVYVDCGGTGFYHRKN